MAVDLRQLHNEIAGLQLIPASISRVINPDGNCEKNEWEIDARR